MIIEGYEQRLEVVLALFCQVRCSGDNDLIDAVTVVVELRPESATDSQAVGEKLRGRIKSLIGISCAVRTGPPGSVPRSQGKAQRVLDRRDQGG